MIAPDWKKSSMNNFAQKLAKDPVFSSLPLADLQKIEQLANSRSYLKGDWITHNGDAWAYLFWVEKGKIVALKESNEGRSLIATTIVAQELFWGLAFFQDDAPMPVALVAHEDCQIRMWSREQLEPFLLKSGKMSWELARQMAFRMQQISDVVDNLAFRAVPGRLAGLLLERYSGSGESPVARDMTLDQMASHIGSTREMVCRALYKFADQGAIKINRTEFVLSDEALLTDIAHHD